MRGFERGFDQPDVWFGRGLWFIGVVIAVLVIAALVAAIVWFVTRNRKPATDSRFAAMAGDPLRLAAARYAAGEIDRDQFDQIRTDLLETATSPGEDKPATEG